MDDGDDMDMSLDGATSKRACDSCRTRKIRCDRAAPCSNCKASKLVCTTTAPTQKAQRQRVHISEEYEKKIDRIEDRLSSIENVLGALASKLGNLDIRGASTETSSQPRLTRVGSGKSPGAVAEAVTPAPFEGETTMNSQSDYAREFVARAVGSTPSIGQDAEIRSALTALGELVTQQNAASANSIVNRPLADFDAETLDRPPWDAVGHTLLEATKYTTVSSLVVFPFLKMENLETIIEDAYHNPSSCGPARRVLAYGVMASLFTEFRSYPMVNMDVTNFGAYAIMCRKHIEVAMSELDLFMPASYENIMALLIGSAEAIEICKPSLCWAMISCAAGLCQSLGYHRINTMVNDTTEMRKSKIQIFWMIYMFDKTLSVRLGRASVIQDWDISLPFDLPDDGSPGDSEGQLLAYWVKVARVQGQTYEKLFCPAAFLKSPAERTRTAVELVDAMNLAWFERGEGNVTDFPVPRDYNGRHPYAGHGARLDASEYIQGSFERIQDIFFHVDVVMHYSTCSLIQRAVSPDNVTFNQECLESSRAALVAHRRANLQFNTKGNEELWSGYIHWSILQAPFTPFIVIFCNAIQNADSSDLASLTDFVASLESCRMISEGADKLYKMCRLFLQVAKLYIQAKRRDVPVTPQQASYSHRSQPPYHPATDSTQVDLNAMTEFDPYLSALGLVPNTAWPIPGFPNASPSSGLDAFPRNQGMGGVVGPDATGMGIGPSTATQNSVQDWFSGSRYLINLMEAGDDLQMPDLNL
ncbi:uncharacterized protein K460DRAFT_361562 [Cucurbitaria berberidis CBS 394.84]|uniref:Zn(2)-C6 fungal-type domain-containing protein n=1 Tax=Cucurbitaria berberidis CBS 394.84 TaxID=1168544 RepID=A0A9P4LDW2_9PLEO|nr:uncharacterized protein K460DRAFT_361562 [Cucurbitaria berberidis CBS 394.84]KAF1850792.1 hypothetical protein K460DRAFT_361562 [Cucurbitaria berberidis CBS 394.84]